MRFRLRYLKHDLELSPGVFVIGRSADCQLSLDDPLVSRKHALLFVGDAELFIEDAGSRNGVLLNSVKIQGRTKVNDGDRITIGAQEMVVYAAPQSDAPKRTWAQPSTTQGPVTIVSLPVARQSQPEDMTRADNGKTVSPEEPTYERPKRGESFKLLGSVAEKALALGNPEGAERLLQNGLQEILTDVRAGRPVSSEDLEVASKFASRLAAGTGKGSWGDYVIELYARKNLMLPSLIVDELYAAAHKMKGFDLTAFRNYVRSIQQGTTELSATERFVLQRLEGLERLLATR